MDAKEYQKIYQNIKEKAPIESGVQTLVYMFLYEIIKNIDYQLIVIDRMGKKTPFVTTVGISDLAIVSDSFSFSEENKDCILSYVEVKGINVNLFDFEDQIKGQLLSRGKIICTNGNVWKYYDIEKYIEQHSENELDFLWGQNDYEKIQKIIASLEYLEKEIAIKKSSYAHARTKAYKEECKSKITELNHEILEKSEQLNNLLVEISWLQDIMNNPIIDRKLCDNDDFDVMEYMKLKSELYEYISEW